MSRKKFSRTDRKQHEKRLATETFPTAEAREVGRRWLRGAMDAAQEEFIARVCSAYGLPIALVAEGAKEVITLGTLASMTGRLEITRDEAGKIVSIRVVDAGGNDVGIQSDRHEDS